MAPPVPPAVTPLSERNRRRGWPSALAQAGLGAAGVAVLAACRGTPSAEVIAADGVLCDITRRLAATDLTVQCLLTPQDDPHQFQLTPTQSRDLRQAQLVLINGYALTPTLERLTNAIPVAERAVPDSPRLATGRESHGAAAELNHQDHDHPPEPTKAHPEHHHRGRDPHVWHDPMQAAALVAEVSEQLQQLRPAAAAAIRQRAAAMTQTLSALDGWNRLQFATLPAQPGQRTLATGHRAFPSLSRAYGLRELAVVDEHSASESLRPQALSAAVKRLQQERVPALFSETWPPSRALSRISALSGVKLAPQPLRADGLAPASATGGREGDLISTLTANTCLIVDQLGGRCNSSGQQQLIRQWQAIR